jgi:predicted AlkP superfamily pyrophosphatase or phosphodiesterase
MKRALSRFFLGLFLAVGGLSVAAPPSVSQQKAQPGAARETRSERTEAAHPKLIVVLVVDQMRADYVDKFQGQWTGGLKRLVTEGAWFREAAYPYANTETCVGHSTISTGAFPAMHGMISNEWWDRGEGKEVTCTEDSNVHNVAYGGASVKGGDSASRMLVPAFADELKFQGRGPVRVVTFSLKARSALTLAGRMADAATWFDSGAGVWTTSSAYAQSQFVADYAKEHPVGTNYGKTWTPLLPDSAYFYKKAATGVVPPPNYGTEFPHPLRGAAGSTGPDRVFYYQWATSPFADTYLERMAADVAEKMHLGRDAGTDFLGISFSSVDYVAHQFGPRSWEVQDELARLDRDLSELFAMLDKSVGRGNYVAVLTADHGGAPAPEDLLEASGDAGRLHIPAVAAAIRNALAGLHYPEIALAAVNDASVYFAPGVYEKLSADRVSLDAVIEAIEKVPGVERVYRSKDVQRRPATEDALRRAEALSYREGRSGDLILVPKPYWIWDSGTEGHPPRSATTHGSPYYYDQRVPLLWMGTGIRPGSYFGAVSPADIAPTLAALCGITLAPRDGRVLAEVLSNTENEAGRGHITSRHAAQATAAAAQH